jgi:hypothetical protein
MTEGELESAICRALPTLLPDLFAEGYRIKSQQAILLGRRIDLLLQKADGSTCIIELKAGPPPMPDVRDQILDYSDCWKHSYPRSSPPRLIVIGHSVPKSTRAELENFGIESRAISEQQVLAALEGQSYGDPVQSGFKLAPEDLMRVRHLLSDHSVVDIPQGLVLGSPWNHEKAFLALVKRGERHKDLWKKNPYVQLYPQTPNCAVLYGPKVRAVKRGPLHLNPRARSWDQSQYLSLEPFVKYSFSDNKGPGRESTNFDWYSILDWDGFARSLGL